MTDPLHAFLTGTVPECSVPVTFWVGSESADPYLLLTDPDPAPDPALFTSDLQDAKKIVLSLFDGTPHLHHSSKIKSHKEVTTE